MVKKKHQSDPQDNDSSTESCDEKRSNNSQGSGNSNICPHLKKAVDSTKLRKTLKSDGTLKDSCSKCIKIEAEAAATATEALELKNEKSTLDDGFEYDKTLWLCLKCGTQLCGRSKNKHALQHFTTSHSDCHALAMNTTTFEIWCYECDDEVKPSVRKNLLECVETIKRMSQKSHSPQVVNSLPMEEETNKIGNRIAFDVTTPKSSLSSGEPLTGNINQILPIGGISSMPSTSGPPPFPGIAQRIHTADTLPRVRGLTNLGNTCFFNAVLQCLAQTPYLVDVLKEACAAGEKFVLPGGTFQFGEEEELELPSIQGFLSSWGDITSALANTLEELQSGGGVYNPSKLFGKLTHKCPQFRGGDQHDSHELLRHLLESVRSEDLRRYQSVILNSLGCRKQDPNLVSNDIKQKCKIYGNQAADRILLPEKVFRGFLVSTLTCQECYHNSSRHESFLDLSLPVSVEKPHPPNRRKNSPENSPTTIGGPSKHQLKKEKEKERKAKRAAKRHNKRVTVKNLVGPAGDNAMVISPIKDQPNSNSRSGSSSSSSSEQSDADVEDNLIEDAPKFASGTQSINRSIPPLYDANGNNEFPSPVIPEKRDDSPENLYKDSNDDGNDSGIATSPANTTASVEQDSKNIAFPAMIGPMSEEHYLHLNDNENIRAKNVVLELGITERGANLIKQRSLMNEDLLDNGKSIISSETSNHVPGGMELPKYNNSNDEDLVVEGQGCQTYNNSNLSKYLSKYLSLENCGDDSCDVANKKKLKAKRVRTQSHSDWSNTMAPRYQCEDGECSVQSCLNNFTTIELMTDNNKVGCDGCTKRINGEDGKTVYTNATKQFLISSPPAVLILHLKRFQVERRMFKKLTRDVNFPMLLDIAPFCGSRVKYLPNIDRKQKKLIYALYGIVEHSGGMYGGHYTAYVKVRAKLSSNDPRWKFLPQGSKAELDQIDEQRAKLDELLAKEKARELRMKENDSDDFTSSNTSASSSPSSSSSSEPDSNEEIEGAVGGSNDAEIKELPGKWYYVSDSHVQEVSEKRVLEAQAYLLFYERIY